MLRQFLPLISSSTAKTNLLLRAHYLIIKRNVWNNPMDTSDLTNPINSFNSNSVLPDNKVNNRKKTVIDKTDEFMQKDNCDEKINLSPILLKKSTVSPQAEFAASEVRKDFYVEKLLSDCLAYEVSHKSIENHRDIAEILIQILNKVPHSYSSRKQAYYLLTSNATLVSDVNKVVQLNQDIHKTLSLTILKKILQTLKDANAKCNLENNQPISGKKLSQPVDENDFALFESKCKK